METLRPELNLILDEIKCKACASKKLRRYGKTVKGSQRWLCLSCRTTFVESEAPRGMRTSADAIGAALSMFYEGSSLRKIQTHLKLAFDVDVDLSTIHRWILRFTRTAIEMLDKVKVDVGVTWLADKTSLRDRDHSNAWVYDCVDQKTKFLLASHLETIGARVAARRLLEASIERAGKVPTLIVTNNPYNYQVYGQLAPSVKDSRNQPFPARVERPGEMPDQLRQMLKGRMELLQGVLTREVAELVLKGWLAHYNFFRPHLGLARLTPAQAAGVQTPLKSWIHVVEAAARGLHLKNASRSEKTTG